MNDYKEAYYKLLKENTQLHDMVKNLNKGHEEYEKKVKSGMSNLINQAESNKDKLIIWLIANNKINNGSQSHKFLRENFNFVKIG